MIDPTEPRVTVTDEMIEQLLLAWFESAPEGATRENVHPRILDRNRPRAAAALAAIAPLIAAQVLEDARKVLRSLADEWEQRADFNAGHSGEFWQGMVVKGRECASEARARADQIEVGR